MSPVIENNRWSVGVNDFAARVILPDLKGFFDQIPFISSLPKAKTLIVEPGTRALMVDEGFLIGEIPPGAYTFEEFVKRLQFWRNKQATAFLVRCEDVPIDSQLQNVPCLDNVCFDIDFRWTVQITDIVQLIANFMGARTELKITELQKLLLPIVSQAIFATIGNTSYDDAKKPTFLQQLQSEVKSQVDLKFQRYGLSLHEIQNLTLTSEADSIPDQKGELFKRTRELQIQQAVSGIEDDELRSRVKDYQNKTTLRDELRKIVTDDRLNKIGNQHEFEKAIFELDKQKLLQTEESDALIHAFESRKEDRDSLRAHLLATLDLQRERDLDELRMEMDHANARKTLAHEMELAKISRSENAEAWRQELEKEKEDLEHRLQQKRVHLKANWDILREKRSLMREDSFAALIHEQKMEDVRLNVDIAKAERTRKLTIIQSELETRLAHDKLEIQKRQQQWELEHRKDRSDNQFDRLQRMQEMNAQFAERQMRMQVDMENLKADGASKRELDRIQALSQVSADVLIATVSTENAALLADLKKAELGRSKRPRDENQPTGGYRSRPEESTPRSRMDEERARLYEKMNETERAKADAIAEAYKMAMQAQQASVNQMIGGLAQASSAQSHATPFGPPPVSHAAPPPMPAPVTWYVSLSGQQSPPLQWPQLQQYIQSGHVHAGTMVWKAGMPNWLPANQVPELASLFGPSGPPGPPPFA